VLAFRFANTFAEAFWNRNYIESVEITMAEDFGVQGRGGAPKRAHLKHCASILDA